MKLDFFVQMGITGITLGLMYALVAIGLTLIFGIMRVVQYAHGELFMLGAYLLFYWFNIWGLPYWAGLVISPLVIFLVGMALQRGLLRPLLPRGLLPALALTIGLVFIISSGGLLFFGTVSRGIPSVITGGVNILGAWLSWERAVISIFAIVVIWGVFTFLQKTRTGIAMRAVAEDPDTASLQGINTGRIHNIAFGFGSALAALAGCLLGTLVSIVPTMGFPMTVKAFMIVILGGLGSVPGALLGGFILGFIDSFVGTLLSSEIAYIIGFMTIFIILIFKPLGLFSHEW
ncbi:MAG TPA: branched-chain amino acid ABC transporter permease [Spirochaetes bacterium]|nr:branched-chain amino acid ABC transporter permease [Spirochaetota bacterium]